MGFALTKLGRAAFTLVEIMIVVAVIVVLAAMTIPGILRTGKHRKSTEILNGLRLRGRKKDAMKRQAARDLRDFETRSVRQYAVGPSVLP
ncbi:MAG TPA: prepilin-type N-terminal cleavage/methylation domain-containing protein [Candidatus Udaeobacter sp.]|jgi:prepilin-type N-terminal cleavage/methylation domain-containing protein